MKSSRFMFLSLHCLFLILSPTANVGTAQDLDNVTVSGRVIDQNGALISGATVHLVLARTGISRTAETDAQGGFRVIHLPPGRYTLRITSAGFAPHETKDISAIAGQNLQIDLTLFPQSLVADPLTINTNATANVDTTRTVVGSTIPTEQIEALPVLTRSPLDLVFTVPGVSEEQLSTRDLAEDRNTIAATTPEEAGIFSLSGAPAYSNNLTIDGLDNNDDRGARERFQPSLEAIEEVQVITNQFSAEYGRASGGRVNIRTRTGSRDFRGRVFYFFRDEALNSNTFKNNYLGLRRLPLQEHVVGFTLGGPLAIPGKGMSERTFFFTAYELQKVLDSALIDTLIPVERNKLFPLPSPTSLTARRTESAELPALAAEIAPFVASVSTPFRDTIFTARVDHLFNGKHNTSFVFQRGRQLNLRQFGGGNRLAETFQGKARNSDAINFSDTYVFNPALVNQIRLQYSRLAPAVRSRVDSQPVVLITINDSLETDNPARRSGTLVAGSSTAGATSRSEKRVQLQELLSLIRREHSLKFGFDAHWIRSTFIDLSDGSGTFNFASAGDFLAGLPSRFRQNFLTSSTQQNAYASFFVQDEWRLRTNLTLSYGLRYERESVVSDRNNFGPRFSLAFDPANSGKSVFRFGFGSFYNRVLLRTVDDFTLGKQQLFFDTNALHDPVTRTTLTSEQRRAFIASHLRFPETLQPDSALVAAFGVLNTNFSRRLDPDLRIPESYQINVGFERDLGKGFAVEANFTRNRGLHLWREFNVNAPILPPGYRNLSEYLASRDFPNFRSNANGSRPLYNATTAGELVRFVFHSPNQTNPNAIVHSVEFGVPISVVNLNSISSTTAVEIALAALNGLRPDPALGEVEQLISAGNSFYNGLTIELRGSLGSNAKKSTLIFRTAYTYSRLVDDGIVNTSDALSPGDFRAERARSLLDRRHRFVFSGSMDLPRLMGGFRVASIFRLTSGAPFNISLGGTDRSLDDVGNDRPNFNGDTRLLRWRIPGKPLPAEVARLFSLPTIGQSGNLPRNAGHGPGQFFLDLTISRAFQVSDNVRISPVIEFDNVLNKTVFSFGSEFINFNSLSPSASPTQRQAFLDTFLVATRTLRPRQIRVGIRIDF